MHGNEQGLGEAILAGYDSVSAPSVDASTNPAARNNDAKDAYAFVVRRLDGSAMPLAPAKGKILVLSFWATWCGPCRDLEPMFNQVARSYAGNSDLAFFAVNTDDEEAEVPSFVAREKWDVPVIYADGLDDFMKVETLPTVLVLDRDGQIIYRTAGVVPEGFFESLVTGIKSALAGPK